MLDKQTWRGTTKEIVINNNGIEATGEEKESGFNRIIKLSVFIWNICSESEISAFLQKLRKNKTFENCA